MNQTSPNLNPTRDEVSSSNQTKDPNLTRAFRNINMHGEKITSLIESDEEELADLKCKMFAKVFNASFLQVKQIEEEMKKIWNLEEEPTLKPIGNNIFMFKLSHEILRKFITNNSPWRVKGACMAVKEWK